MNDSTPSVRIGPISLFALIAVICLATLENGTVTAQFACPNGRLLDIAVAPEGNGYRIAKWNMTAKVNSAETDTLWSGM